MNGHHKFLITLSILVIVVLIIFHAGDAKSHILPMIVTGLMGLISGIFLNGKSN